MMMRLVVDFMTPGGTTIVLLQCPKCKDVIRSRSYSRVCDKCSDEEIPTNSRMTL